MLDMNFLKELAESLDVETDIHCHVIPGGATTIRAQGNQPSLFSATCEIVKAVAMNESAATRRDFVKLVCDIVLIELKEEGDCDEVK